MGTAVISTACLVGIEAKIVEVEVHLQKTIPKFEIVGLPDNSIKESRIRVMSAIKNTLTNFPLAGITVNLSPANIHKHGTGFDLPIALGIMAASGVFESEKLKKYLTVGELSLMGGIKPVKGALSIAHSLKYKLSASKKLILNQQNANEAALVSGIDILYADSLISLINALKYDEPLAKITASSSRLPVLKDDRLDIGDVKGQENGKRALEIAAGGGHHLLFFGPPGSGKTMLAKRMPGLMPKLSLEEAIENTKIYSAAGLETGNFDRFWIRPFREAHHKISSAGLIGGGSNPSPGEISLAHNGVLFMDEFAEFPRSIIDLLRQPLENNEISISRAKFSVKFPCRFQLIVAMNPCPCGYYLDKNHPCRCSNADIARYRGRISGPIADRIDLQVLLPNISYKKMQTKNKRRSEDFKTRIAICIKRQQKRFNNNWRKNAELEHSEVEKFAKLNDEAKKFLNQAMDNLKFSNRAYDKILKISLTIADLADKDIIEVEDIAEALNYRFFDRRAI